MMYWWGLPTCYRHFSKSDFSTWLLLSLGLTERLWVLGWKTILYRITQTLMLGWKTILHRITQTLMFSKSFWWLKYCYWIKLIYLTLSRIISQNYFSVSYVKRFHVYYPISFSDQPKHGRSSLGSNWNPWLFVDLAIDFNHSLFSLIYSINTFLECLLHKGMFWVLELQLWVHLTWPNLHDLTGAMVTAPSSSTLSICELYFSEIVFFLN